MCAGCGSLFCTIAPASPPSSSPAQETEPAPVVIIPRNTEVVITLQTTISTRTAMVGDKFHGQVDVPVVVDDQIVIPRDTWVVGEVKSSQRAGRIRGRAELQLGFNSIILPSGESRTITARLRSADNYRSEDIVRSEGAVKAESKKGEDAGTVAKGAAAGAVIVGATSRSIRGAAIGSGAGALGGLGLVMLGRGDDVQLQKGTQITLILDQDVSLRKK